MARKVKEKREAKKINGLVLYAIDVLLKNIYHLSPKNIHLSTIWNVF